LPFERTLNFKKSSIAPISKSDKWDTNTPQQSYIIASHNTSVTDSHVHFGFFPLLWQMLLFLQISNYLSYSNLWND